MSNRIKRSIDRIKKSTGKLFTNKIAKPFGRMAKAVKKWFVRVGKAIVRVSPPWLRRFGSLIARPFRALARRHRNFMARRPHRSFRLTRRRDYKRSLKLPGYWSFTGSVWMILWRNKKLFGGLILTYFLISVAISGIGAQESYRSLSEALAATSGDLFTGNWGNVSAAGLLLVTTVTNGLSPNVTEAQSVIATLAVFFAWLVTVWLMRNVVAGRRVRLRDGLYNASSPILSTLIVGVVLIIQIIPVSLALLVYAAASSSGLLDSGVAAMLFWVAAGAFTTMTLYWVTSTLIALVVVTIPGMYPFQAVRTAGDLVVGRRLRILFRWIWLAFIIVAAWLIVVVPIIMFDGWLTNVAPAVSWIPIVPVSIMLMTSLSIVYISSYIYLIYRKVVDDDHGPA